MHRTFNIIVFLVLISFKILQFSHFKVYLWNDFLHFLKTKFKD